MKVGQASFAIFFFGNWKENAFLILEIQNCILLWHWLVALSIY